MKNKILTIGALAALTALTPVRAVEAEVEADADLPKIRTETELKRDRDADLDVDIRKDKDIHVEADADLKNKQVTKMNKASGLMGMEVRNPQGEKLGEIKDVVLDLNSGKISYAVLAVGGFLGLGEKLIAVPPGAIRGSDKDGYLLLDADKSKIEAAPGFAATSWPSPSDPEFNRYWISSVGGPAERESGTRDADVDVDIKKKSKIYTDADEKKIETKVEVDKD